jgi:transmembrane sensor
MTLDTDTAVAVDMGRDRRQVTLRKGRARFAVAAERRPFLVRAGSSVVTAPHAVFDVSLSGDRTVASAIAGALTITVTRKGENTPSGAAVELQTGQQASIRPGGTEHDSVARRDAIWPTGMLEFESTPLGEAVAQTNRYSTAKIRIADPAVERLRVTGAFRAGDIPGVARALGAAFGLRIDRTPSGDYLLFSRP